MINKSCNKNRFYYVQCGDWEGVSLSESPREASLDMISRAPEDFKNNSKKGKVAIVMDMRDEMESVSTHNVSAFSLDSLSLQDS